MDSITFKNFRTFKEKTTFELNNVNLLVGKNNSGKSNLTKGLRLYLYNILNLCVDTDNVISVRPFFQFGGQFFDNTHIGTFGRALSFDTKEETISFSAKFVDFEIETIVSRYSIHSVDSRGKLKDYFNETSAPITQILIYDGYNDTKMSFDFEKETQRIEFNATGHTEYYNRWRNELESLKNEQKKDGIDPNDVESRINRLAECVNYNLKEQVKWEGHLQRYSEINGLLYKSIVEMSFRSLFNDDKLKGFDATLSNAIKKEGNEVVSYLFQIYFELLDDLNTVYLEKNIENIEAHSITRSIVYNISDKNDYMAQTILDYMNSRIKDGDPEKDFIENWMMKFEIGEDFVIESFGGECYKLGIINDVDHPEKVVPLLDKGVGSNQVMILLLRIATIMRRNRGTSIPSIIVVEEPEQNLHPKLQSYLADMFYEVYKYPQITNKESWGITFVIETHSEYLVRKTQIIVKEEVKTEEVPFNVYYLDGNNAPQKMKYQKNGVFANNFGEGFYDEAIKLIDKIV